MVRWLSAAALLGLLLAAAAVLLFPPAASGPDSAVGGGPAADLPRHASPPDGTAQASAASLREPPRTAPPVPAVPVVPYWERVKRDCPWPPTLDSWTEVSGECDAALMESPRFFTGWRRRLSLHDPEETRRAVVAALDDPQCRVPPGEERPDLYEACAAEALIRFAEMQHTCVNVLGRDWDLAERSSRNLMEWRILKTGDLQEHRELAESGHWIFAELLWGYSLCSRVPPGVLDWLDVLPVPEANPEQQPKRYLPAPTQAPELREIARRLGATIPPLPGSPSSLMVW